MESKIITIPPSLQQKKTIRVAAYCRVSSDSSDQIHSFAAQVQYYTTYINENEMMELVDIYADKGLTGTKTDKRNEFNRLIADCKKGKIDRVLTKSVSRFARNTADAIMYARLLKEYEVSILFEKENIDTAYMSSELLLAISGAQAQEESISISKNIRLSVEQRMRNGTFMPSSTPYGFELKNGEFCIVENEAEIVRLIFKSYLSGMGKKAIADMLNEIDAPKRENFKTWRTETVGYILGNERYIGDALLQKRYSSSTLPFTTKLNHGERPQYYVVGANPQIISKEDFEAAQKITEKKRYKTQPPNNKRTLIQKIKCKCGAYYTPITVKDEQYWGCKTHDLDTKKCDSQRIPEKDIYNAYITMMNKLRNIRTDLLPCTISQIERLQMKSGGASSRIKEIDKEIAELTNKNLVLVRLHSKGILRSAEYTEESRTVNSCVNKLRSERRKLLQEQDEDNVLSGLRKLDELLTNMKYPITEFNPELFENTINEITVPSNTSICFELISGLKITEKIPERRRCGQ